MKGHLRSRSPGSWEVIVELPRNEDGKRRQKSTTIRGTKRDAQTALNGLLADIERGIHIEPKTMTTAAFLREWLEHSGSGLSPKSQERYREVITKHLIPALGNILLSKLKPFHLRTYYSDAAKTGRCDGSGGLAPRTIEYHHHVLHKALSDAVKWEFIMRNPASAVTPPRADRYEADVLTAQQIMQLLFAAQNTRYYVPALLAVTTGMRRGEICALRWEDVDLAAGTLAVRRTLQQTRDGLTFREPKTNSSVRVVALLPMTVTALKQHREQQAADAEVKKQRAFYQDNGLVYCRDDGGPVHPDSLSHNFHRILELAKLPRCRFHDLRHSHATVLLGLGVHPRIAQERLGHSSISVTMDLYSHVGLHLQTEAMNKLQTALDSEQCWQNVGKATKKPSEEVSEG